MTQKESFTAILERMRLTSVTEQEAFDCYRRLEKPTTAAVVEHFAKLNRNPNSSLIEKWVSDGEWESRVNLDSAILVLQPDQPRGLAHRLITRLAGAIEQLEIKTVSDFARLCDVMLKLEKACSELLLWLRSRAVPLVGHLHLLHSSLLSVTNKATKHSGATGEA